VRGLGRVPLVAGGRSSGARVACRTAAAAGAVGVVALAFPLAPPGRPERTRAAELLDVGVPVLVVQGERDAFGSAADVRAASASAPSVRVVTVPGADHGFRARRADGATTAECLVEVAAAVRAFVHALVG
jgi:predicted alpha/beta-hydrolase family hydrolase